MTFFVIAVCIPLACMGAKNAFAADFQTANFIIRNAPNHELARQFGETAEQCRKELAILWVGEELPQWSAPCPITVKVGNLGAGGETSMQFANGHVYDWDMRIQGSAEAIVTAVLPHEITHMILASHFRERVPRWADEGAATYVENEKERQNYRRLLYQYLRTGRGIPFNQMFRLAEYPDDQMPLYAQGFSLAEFLIMQQSHQHYVRFVEAGMVSQNWPQAIRDYYGYENLGELQVKWNRWVDAGCPNLQRIDPNQPIFVREATQYVASRDFFPAREPVIFAQHRSATTGPVTLASLETPRQTEVASSEQMFGQNIMTQEPEPIHLALPQVESNTMLAASLAPIPESRVPFAQIGASSVVNRPHHQFAAQAAADAPQAVFAQPIEKQGQTTNQPLGEHRVESRSQTATPQVVTPRPYESRLPSHFLQEEIESQNSRQMIGPSQSTSCDTNVIFDWRIR